MLTCGTQAFVLLASVIVIIILGLILFSPLFRGFGLDRVTLIASFILKCGAGIMLWYLYTYALDIERQDADIYRYFDDAMVMNSALDQSTQDYIGLLLDREDETLMPYYERMYNWDRSYALIQLNDNRSMIRLHAVMSLLTGGDLLSHVILFALLAFIGLLYLYKGFSFLIELPSWMFLVAFILPPSLLLWSSAPLKECLVMLPLGLSFYGTVSWFKGERRWAHLVTGLILFLFIKPYVLLSFAVLFFYLLIRKLVGWKLWPSILTTLILVIVTLVSSSLSSTNDIIGILALKMKDFIAMAQETQAGSYIEIPQFDDFWSFILHAPGAVLRTYFRPGLWEVSGALQGIAAVENTGYILLLLAALIWRRKIKESDLLVICAIFLLTMGVLIGSVTPVMGAIVRYKVPALPFLLVMVYQLADFKRLGFK